MNFFPTRSILYVYEFNSSPSNLKVYAYIVKFNTSGMTLNFLLIESNLVLTIERKYSLASMISNVLLSMHSN